MQDLIGWNLDSALLYLKENNIDFRIVRQGKNNFVVTCDFVMDRLNLEIDNGVITKITYG